MHYGITNLKYPLIPNYQRTVRKSTEHFLYLHVLAGINNELKEKSTFYDKK